MKRRHLVSWSNNARPVRRALLLLDVAVAPDGAGQPTAIVAPGGQRTTLAVEANGYLASIANPKGESTALTYGADGLLATLTDPRTGLHQYTYDALGRLTKDEDPATGFKMLTRTELNDGWRVDLSTALNRITCTGAMGVGAGAGGTSGK